MRHLWTLCIALLITTTLWAGTIDVRFANARYEANKYIAEVQVRAADISLELGSATVFFNYNTTAIAHPSYTALHFNETNSCGAGGSFAPYKNNFTYMERNEIGEANYAINLMVANMGCPTVDATWVSVAEFSFDVINPTATPMLAFSHEYTAFNTVDNSGAFLTIGSLQNLESANGVNTVTTANGSISVSPTVTSNALRVSSTLLQPSKVNISIYSLLGQNLYSAPFAASSTNFSTDLELAKILNTTSYYLVEVEAAGVKSTSKILFVK